MLFRSAKHADDAKWLPEMAKVLSKVFLRFMPDDVARPMFKMLTKGASERLDLDPATLNKLVDKGVEIDKLGKYADDMLSAGSDPAAIKELIEKQADGTIKISLEKTFWAVKSEKGTVDTMWLEKGQLRDGSLNPYKYDTGGAGWEHIRNNHIVNPSGNQFLRYGSQYSEEENVQDLIRNAVKNGDEHIVDGDIWRVSSIDTSEGKKYISILVGSNGYIVNALPHLADSLKVFYP